MFSEVGHGSGRGASGVSENRCGRVAELPAHIGVCLWNSSFACAVDCPCQLWL